MLTKSDISDLIKDSKLFQMEVDDRHMNVINEAYLLGIEAGLKLAKEQISWRINGEVWCKFIDEGVKNASTKTA